VSSLETRVLVSARRFATLDVVDGDLPTPAPVNPQLSVVTAPELVASAEEQVVSLDRAALDRDTLDRLALGPQGADRDEQSLRDAARPATTDGNDATATTA